MSVAVSVDIGMRAEEFDDVMESVVLIPQSLCYEILNVRVPTDDADVFAIDVDIDSGGERAMYRHASVRPVRCAHGF